MTPTGNFYEEDPPFEAFMALATIVYDDPSDEAEVARVLARARNHGKNRANTFVMGTAEGKCTAINQGGSYEALKLARTDLTVHDRREKVWAIKCSAASLTGIAFESDASPGLA